MNEATWREVFPGGGKGQPGDILLPCSAPARELEQTLMPISCRER